MADVVLKRHCKLLSFFTIICSKSAISLQRVPVDPKFQVEEVAPPTIFFSED